MGHDTPPLNDDQMREALRKPFDSEPLSELARGKKQAVILFDDLTRPAPTWKILPFVLEVLNGAGIPDGNIRFVCAFANHAAMSQEDFVKKLGEDVVRRFRIYNHNPYEHLVDLGKTEKGTPVLINREVMACDLKIGIGGLIPHLGAGFGGGAKLVLPGVAGIESADYNHRKVGSLGGDRSKNLKFRLGEVENNELRRDIEEAVRKVGLDFKIDLLINYRREIVGVFAGDFIAQHRAGVEKAKELYTTPVVPDCDIVVMNAFPIENQMIKGIWPGRLSLKDGGTAVVVDQSVEGQAAHYLAGRFGTDYGGKMWSGSRGLVVPQADRLLVCSSYLALNDLDMYGPPEKVVPCSTWGEILIQLLKNYPQQAKVAVYPYAAIQYPGDA
jgi:nickel-dependent lactate racemase